MWKKYCSDGQTTDDNVIRCMRFACCIIKATNINSEFVILLFPLRQQLRESVSMLLLLSNSPDFSIMYIFRATVLYSQYLTPNSCTMFLFVNYCFGLFRPQLLAIFKELNSFFDMCSLFVKSVTDIIYMTKIINKIKY